MEKINQDLVYPINAIVEDDLTTWKIYLLADKIAYMNKSIYMHRILNASMTAQVDKSSVFPAEAVEQRVNRGFDVTEEKTYEKRLTLLQFDDDYFKSRDARQKLAILKKYRGE